MSTKSILKLTALLCVIIIRAQDVLPQPRVVDPGGPDKPPSDAIVLFNGRDMESWTTRHGAPATCQAVDSEMICRSGDGDTMTKQTFGDAQIHLEFKVPYMPNQTGQLRGNSGVYVHGAWEVQILDSFENPTYPDGMLGSIYSFSSPLVNAARPPEQWQTYDIVVRMPVCDAEGALVQPGRMTVSLNSILVQDDTKLDRLGPGHIDKALCEPGPLLLQDHSGFEGPMTIMRFRNVWVRPLKIEATSRVEPILKTQLER
jgi:hypothetical protein